MIRYLVFCVLLAIYAVQGQTVQETSTIKSNEGNLLKNLTKMIPNILDKYEENDRVISRLKKKLIIVASEDYDEANQKIVNAHKKNSANKTAFCMKNSTQQVVNAYNVIAKKVADECFSDYTKLAAQIIDLLKKGLVEPSELIKLLDIPSDLPDKTIVQFVKFAFENHAEMSRSKQTSCVNESRTTYRESLDNAVEFFKQCSEELQNQ